MTGRIRRRSSASRSRVAAALDRSAVVLIELALRREQPGRGDREQAPQLAEVVLHRRAGDGELERRGQLLRARVVVREVVLRGLRLVQHQAGPVERVVGLELHPEQRVGRDDDVGAADDVGKFCASPSAVVSVIAQTRSDGAKRAASPTQLDITLVGATIRNGASARAWQISASACTVLPSPMSSARTPPRPLSYRKASQRSPSSW